MNMFGRALAGELLLSSPPSLSRKCLSLLLRQQQLQIQHPVAFQQQRPSLYSTTTGTKTRSPSFSKNQGERYTAKNPKPLMQPEIVQNQTPEAQRVIPPMEQWIKKKEQLPNADLPRPSEIPWQSKVANSVNLIGQVQIPVQFEASPDGKYWAGTIISQSDGNSLDTPPFWIPIIFEGDLAHIAACHLKAKDRVHISGQLSADPPPFTMGEGQANVQVMVRSISFVQGSSQMKKVVTPQNLQQDSSDAVSVIEDGGDPAFQSWRDLVRNPLEWWDNREDKLKGSVKPNYPDFKHKDSGLSLWLNRAPKWLWPQLEGLEFTAQLPKVKQGKSSGGGPQLAGLEFAAQLPKVKQGKSSKDDDSWKNLVENPDKWWDNRTNKIKEKSPDFKHKVTGEALWLSNSPDWVLSRLPPLNATRAATFAKRDKPLSEAM